MFTVYITSKIPTVGVNLLRSKGFNVEINQNSRNLTKDELVDIFSKYDAVLTLMTDKIDAGVLKHSKNLKIIANFAIGFDNIDVLEAKRRGIIVTNTPGVASEAVAEHTIMLILACVKKLIEADKYVRLGKFQRWDPLAFLNSEISGKNLGIIGLGSIGTNVGQIARQGFGMKILYFDILRSEDFELLTEAKFTTLETLLQEADTITIHCPLTEKTRHLISKNELKLMKKTAILINTSRGPVVDENALIWALREGEIAAAGLDVYEREPHVPEELKTLSNVILTPHMASATIQVRENMAKIAAQNIIAVFEGKEPLGLIKVN